LEVLTVSPYLRLSVDQAARSDGDRCIPFAAAGTAELTRL
jgi:hypothetical protein